MPDPKRLTNLRVNEISLVDKPAIVEEFIVTKRADPTPQAPNATPTTVVKNDAGSESTTTAAPEGEPTTTTKAEGDTGGGSGMPVHEALVQEKVQAISSGLQKLVADLASGAVDSDECRQRMWAIQDLCWDLCRDAAALNVAKSVDGPAKIGKALETIQKARESMKVEKAEGEGDGAQKQPGMKKFTKARVEKLAGGLAAIHEVLQEVAPGDVQKALSSLAGGDDEPGEGSTNSVPTPPTAAPVAKAADGPQAVELKKAQDEAAAAKAEAAVAKSAAESAKTEAEAAKSQLAELSKRLEKLEAVGISKSAGGDAAGGDSGGKKNIWDGLPL